MLRDRDLSLAINDRYVIRCAVVNRIRFRTDRNFISMLFFLLLRYFVQVLKILFVQSVK